MGRISFENYGRRAKLLGDNTSISGRYLIQKEAERNIVIDIIQKMSIEPIDTCLDIGCGVGNILIPLSFFVKKITGIDHNLVLEKLRARYSDLSNIELISGNFLDINIRNTFSKVIVYSVIHYLRNVEEFFKFLDKTVSLLVPGGKALFGDIPNASRKERFLSSKRGKDFFNEWNEKLKENLKMNEKEQLILEKLPVDDVLVIFNDEILLKIIKYLRDKGYNSYILPQPPFLPFGYTREDILIEKPL